MNSQKSVRNLSNPMKEHRITFSIQKNLTFGQAMYVCGSTLELGLWNPQEALRLSWNQNDIWTGEIVLATQTAVSLEYKYAISDWENPSLSRSEWEIGYHNRKVDLSPQESYLICDDRWNYQKISLCLVVDETRTEEDVEYYVLGSLPELGGWQNLKLMNKGQQTFTNCTSTIPLQENNSKEHQIWTFSFEVFRLQEQFYYYYLRKKQSLEPQRKPGRIFNFNKPNACFPCRKKVDHPRGEVRIVDQSCLNSLKFSKITTNIFVGSYPKTAEDLAKLKQRKIDAILSIQSESDYYRHGISPYNFRRMCKQNGIKFKRCSIEDMNNPDFIENADEGIQIMEEILSSGGNIYVHCSAGIYRSPQMIALYLIAIKKYKLEEAVRLLKERHPYSRPSPNVIEQALSIYESGYVKKRVRV